ncbi:ribonuclease J [Halovulum sp. GXIMD14793]
MSKENKLTYLALGGAGEIGMNMYLYGYGPVGDQRFILVDCGVTFPSMDGTPGVDLIMADPQFIADRADRLEAILITHAHEDHIGALGLLIDKLQAPVYARRFTAEIARQKLDRFGKDPDIVHEVGPWPEMTDMGPFRVGFLPVAHSVPEASGLVIDTQDGRLVHTGDLKLDRTPLVGEPYDPDVLRDIAKDGVKALICDSTNVFSPKPGRSEAEIKPAITELIRNAKGLVGATTFASNIARLKTLAQAAHDAGRSVVILGRAMNTMLQTAVSTGVLTDFPPVVPIDEAHDIARNDLFILATGSQGERRAATAQLSSQSYQGFQLKKGDTFLFSSKTIPGNEVPVSRILNQMSEAGVSVIDDSSGLYHVSGHANRPDLQELHRVLAPANLIAMHGEHRHLREHTELAEASGINGVLAPNGAIVDLTSEKAEVIDNIETGRVYQDGSVLIGAMDGVVRDRMRMALRGLVTVSVMLEADGSLIDGVWVDTLGMPGEPGLSPELEAVIETQIEGAARKVLDNDDALERLIVKAVQSESQDHVGKKPLVTVLINRFEE